MKAIWWILGGLFFLANKPQPVNTAPGGMTPVEPVGDAVGKAIDASTGQGVTVVNPLPTTIVGTIAPATTFSPDPSDEFVHLPPINSTFATPQPMQPRFIGPPIAADGSFSVPIFAGGQLGNDAPPVFLPNPDTLPGVWPGLVQPTPAPTLPLAPGDPRESAAVNRFVPDFDINQDSFFVPGLGEEDFSPGLSADTKLSILRAQGYTGPDPRMVSTTPISAAQDTNPLVNPATGRVALPNV